ncbi:MAG TPA: metallophosphoesterase [Steroidobacteraceae bacterium]|nr:metallophosphoesterase [Steroidobacteraceae bacterium]
MTTLLQVSDPHFGTEQAPVVQALLRFAAEQRPDVLVLSGDITQRARRRQFEAARRFVDLVAAPATVAIPGNHDIPLFNLPARMLSPYGGYRRVFGDDLEPSFAAPDVLVVAVNTTRPRRHKDGEVSSEQVARVERRLRSALPSQLRVVVVHQPVMAVRVDDDRNLLHGRAEAVRTWVAGGADLVMGGHIHWPYACPLRTGYRDLPREAWVVQAGTAVSSRVRDGVPNSVNVVRTTAGAAPRRCAVERWDYEAVADRFRLVERHDPTFS